jgi:class 3 adenylate cyclase/alpha-beta hydrolase superfamily lysophospholipase
MQVPETRYTRSGDVNIAYQVAGGGSVDLLWIPGFAQHLELAWEEPWRRAWLEALAAEYRVIVFDKRGTGLSDRVAGAPPVEVRMDDCRAVLDAAESQRAAILTAGDSSDLALVFAATYPERVRALVIWNGQFRGTWAPDYPWAAPREEALREIGEHERRWPASLLEGIEVAAPSLDQEEREAFARVIRFSVSPGSAAAYWRMALDVDVRGVLPSVRVPVLVMSRAGSANEDAGRWVASRLPAGEFVAIDRPDSIPVVGDPAPLLDELRRFVTRTAASVSTEIERVLATVLFTDIVGSTARAAELGDRAWRALLESHHSVVRDQLVRFRGTEHDTAGDGFFASFDGPARAIRCARAIRDAVERLDLEVRAGIHTGECELLEGKVSGIAVATGARVSAHASPGEVLVSQTVKDLVAGSEITFDDRGSHELKGIPGKWRLYAVNSS